MSFGPISFGSRLPGPTCRRGFDKTNADCFELYDAAAACLSYWYSRLATRQTLKVSNPNPGYMHSGVLALPRSVVLHQGVPGGGLESTQEGLPRGREQSLIRRT